MSLSSAPAILPYVAGPSVPGPLIAVLSPSTPAVLSYVVGPSIAGPSNFVAPFSATHDDSSYSDSDLASVSQSSASIFLVLLVQSHSCVPLVSAGSFSVSIVDGSLDAAGLARRLAIAKHHLDSTLEGLAVITAELHMARDENDKLRFALILLHGSFLE